jgi:hypothetical protein
MLEQDCGKVGILFEENCDYKIFIKKARFIFELPSCITFHSSFPKS